MKITKSFSIYVASLLLCFVMVLTAEELKIHRYTLPDYGTLELKAPASWKDTLKPSPHRLPATIVFKPGAGKPFDILITPFPPAGNGMPPPTAESARQRVKLAADNAASQAVEQSIEIKELKGASGTGYYFTATDRAPAPGEYKYMTQGMILVEDVLLAFTILTNDGQDAVITEALSVLKGAAHVSGGTA